MAESQAFHEIVSKGSAVASFTSRALSKVATMEISSPWTDPIDIPWVWPQPEAQAQILDLCNYDQHSVDTLIFSCRLGSLQEPL